MICGHGHKQKFKYPYPRDSKIIQIPYPWAKVIYQNPTGLTLIGALWLTFLHCPHQVIDSCTGEGVMRESCVLDRCCFHVLSLGERFVIMQNIYSIGHMVYELVTLKLSHLGLKIIIIILIIIILLISIAQLSI